VRRVDITVHPLTVSDHGLVIATVPFLHKTLIHVEGLLRNWRVLDRDAFREALLSIPAFADSTAFAEASVSDLFAIYMSSMTDIVNTLLLAHAVKMRCSVLTPWFDAECRSHRRNARRLERLSTGGRKNPTIVSLGLGTSGTCIRRTRTKSSHTGSSKSLFTPGSQGSFGRPSTTSWVVPVRDQMLLCRSSQLMPS